MTHVELRSVGIVLPAESFQARPVCLVEAGSAVEIRCSCSISMDQRVGAYPYFHLIH